ncbi:MAG: NblA/ycf18 family protein, partial [Cyanobacteria bacterium J06642_3]
FLLHSQIITSDRVKPSSNLFTIEKIDEVAKMDRLENNLTMEQELNHRIFSDRVQHLSRVEAQDLLVMMHKQMMFKENLYKELFLNQEKDIVNSLFGDPKN